MSLSRALLVALLASLVAVAPARAGDVEREARRLEHRLLAPCCYQQTLHVHDSELTTTLRRELRARLSTGEGALAIEADLVTRYGERVLAVPPGNPLEATLTGVLLALLGALVLLWRKARHWTRASDHAASPVAGALADDDEEAALSRELERMDT